MVRALAAAVLVVLLGACADDAVSRAVGARCTRDDQCDGRCLTGAQWPDGFCTVSCDIDSDCPAQSLCMKDDGGDGGVCVFSCATDGGCAFLNGTYTCQERDDQAPNAPKVNVCRGS